MSVMRIYYSVGFLTSSSSRYKEYQQKICLELSTTHVVFVVFLFNYGIVPLNKNEIWNYIY
jgi:hypothetical protein